VKRRSRANLSVQRVRALQRRLNAILKKHPEADREHVWHTLLLLEEPPIERLRRGLLRARTFDFH
jgi:hypothetical protein